MSIIVISEAIRGMNQLRFDYRAGRTPGLRLVEPHMLAYNPAGNLALSAWYLGGESESQAGQGWREYLLTDIVSAIILPQRFEYSRPGYDPTGGKRFFNIQCCIAL